MKEWYSNYVTLLTLLFAHTFLLTNYYIAIMIHFILATEGPFMGWAWIIIIIALLVAAKSND